MAETVYDAQTRFLDELLGRERAAAERMIGSYAPVYNRLSLEWQKVLNEIAAIDENATDPRRVANLVFNAQRIEQLRLQTAAEIARFSDQASAQTRRQQAEAIQLGTTHAEALTQLAMGESAYGFSFSFARLPRGALENLTGSFETGSPLKDLFDQLGPQAASGAQKVLFNALATGTNPRIAAVQLRDQLGLPLGRALTIARTEQLRSYREANRQSYERNADVVKGWRWVAHIGRRTCAICWAQHGTFHKLGERMGSHPNCRCSMVPVTRSWEEMGFPPEVARLAPPPLDTQRSGIELFREQPKADQLAVLGPRKFAMYQQHKLGIQDLVVTGNHPRWGPISREGSIREALLLRSSAKPWLVLTAPKVEPFVLPVEKPRLPTNPIDHVRALLLKDPTASPTQLALRVMQDYGGNVTVTPLQVTHARQALERQGLIDRRGKVTPPPKPSRPTRPVKPTPTKPPPKPKAELTFGEQLAKEIAQARVEFLRRGIAVDEKVTTAFGARVRAEVDKRLAAKGLDRLLAEGSDLRAAMTRITSQLAQLDPTAARNMRFSLQYGLFKGKAAPLADEYLASKAALAANAEKVLALHQDTHRQALSEIRPLGPTKDVKQTWSKGSETKAKEMLDSVMQFMPRDWIKRSADTSPIHTTIIQRGYYDTHRRGGAHGHPGEAWIRLSDNPREGRQPLKRGVDTIRSVAAHELGHRMEDVIPGVRGAEAAFYERRTAGEKLRHIPGDKPNAMARFDKFTEPYMGRDYDDAWYELLSMGHESVFFNQWELERDQDFRDFVLGILAVL